jgi:Na+/phosphate symporter
MVAHSPNHATVALNLTKNSTTRSEIIDLKINLERASKLCSNFCKLPIKNKRHFREEK